MHALEKTLIKTELRQRREEGCDVAAIEQKVAQAFAEEAPNNTFKTLQFGSKRHHNNQQIAFKTNKNCTIDIGFNNNACYIVFYICNIYCKKY